MISAKADVVTFHKMEEINNLLVDYFDTRSGRTGQTQAVDSPPQLRIRRDQSS